MKIIKLSCLALSALLVTPLSMAQSQRIVSIDDQVSSFSRVGFLGLRDNADGVFSDPLERSFRERLKTHKQISFDITSDTLANPIALTQAQRASLIAERKWDGALWGEVVKNNQAYRMRFLLYDRQGRLYLENERAPLPEMSIANITRISEELLTELIAALPYQGWVIGRQQNMVTLNFGSKQGARENQTVNAVMITHLRRHPRADFVTDVEKQIMGNILIQKVEPDISFGSVTSERYPGQIARGTKIEASRTTEYPALIKTESGELIHPSLNSQEAKLVVGQNPNEWATHSPQFGRLGFSFGLGQLALSQNLVTTGNISGTQSLLPQLNASGELWLTPKVAFDFKLTQAMGALATTANAAQSKLNYSSTETSLGGEHRWLFEEDDSRSYFGAGLWLFSSRYEVEQSSPVSLTSTTFSGFDIGLNLRFALPKSALAVGGGLKIPLTLAMSENPASSGSENSPKKAEFGINLEYFVGPLKSLVFGVDFLQYSATFSGTGSRGENATSHSHNSTRLHGGLNYYF